MSRSTKKLKQQLGHKQNVHPLVWVLLVVFGVVVVFGAFQFPAVKTRLAPRIAQMRVAIRNMIAPPEKSVFVPQGVATATLAGSGEPAAAATTEAPVTVITVIATPTVTEALPPTATPELVALPPMVYLDGFEIEYQTFNNCGPANLSMMLNYWGHHTTQGELKPYLRPSREDRNVNLFEMETFVNQSTPLKAVERYGGDLQLLKRLVAAGFPVLLERGHTDPRDGWMGHYSIIDSYDDSRQRVHIPDSLVGNLYISYDELMKDWLHFANIYLVIYPPERESEVMNILGSHADKAANLQTSMEMMTEVVSETLGQDQFFAWYSKGTLLTQMGRYLEAAEAYDQAFAIYPTLELKERPWRLTWYQEGPYLAYYGVGRYTDTLNLAIKTLDDTTEDSLPETWWWAGRAAAALGQTEEAIRYFREALSWYPNWQPAVDELTKLGAQP